MLHLVNIYRPTQYHAEVLYRETIFTCTRRCIVWRVCVYGYYRMYSFISLILCSLAGNMIKSKENIIKAKLYTMIYTWIIQEFVGYNPLIQFS